MTTINQYKDFSIIDNSDVDCKYNCESGFFNCMVQNETTGNIYNYQACLMNNPDFGKKGAQRRSVPYIGKVEFSATCGLWGVSGNINRDLITHLRDNYINFEDFERWILNYYNIGV